MLFLLNIEDLDHDQRPSPSVPDSLYVPYLNVHCQGQDQWVLILQQLDQTEASDKLCQGTREFLARPK